MNSSSYRELIKYIDSGDIDPYCIRVIITKSCAILDNRNYYKMSDDRTQIFLELSECVKSVLENITPLIYEIDAENIARMTCINISWLEYLVIIKHIFHDVLLEFREQHKFKIGENDEYEKNVHFITEALSTLIMEEMQKRRPLKQLTLYQLRTYSRNTTMCHRDSSHSIVHTNCYDWVWYMKMRATKRILNEFKIFAKKS